MRFASTRSSLKSHQEKPIRHPSTLWRLPGLPAFNSGAKGELLHLRPIHSLQFLEDLNINHPGRNSISPKIQFLLWVMFHHFIFGNGPVPYQVFQKITACLHVESSIVANNTQREQNLDISPLPFKISVACATKIRFTEDRS